MDKWLLLPALFLSLSVLRGQSVYDDGSAFFCRKKTSLLNGEELICHDTDLEFFKRFDLILTKTHWFTCDNCTLNRLDNTTFSHVPSNAIAYLHLIRSDIFRISADSFAKFPALRSLHLRSNSVEQITAGAFDHLKKLLSLDLGDNTISVLPDGVFAPLHNLDLLNLNRNRIVTLYPDSFVGLKNLKYLYLNENQIERLDANVFGHLPNLSLLYLEHNRIGSIDASAFVNLERLRSLYLNNNTLTALLQYNFKALRNLVDLQLRHNALAQIETSAFNGLQSVHSLHLGRNNIVAVKPYGFVGLDALDTLELIGNELDTLDLDQLAALPNLSYLWLQHNRIANVTLDIRNGDVYFRKLTSLGLEYNNLTALNYKLLDQKMPKLKDLFVDGNPWRCEPLVNMFNFFREQKRLHEVNVCASEDCNANKTRDYVEEVCEKLVALKDDEQEFENEDYVVEGATFAQCTLLLVLCNAVLVLFLSLYNSTSLY